MSDQATDYGVFFIAPFSVEVTGFFEVHQVAGTDGSAVTLQLEKLTSGQALDAGATLLDSTINLKATKDTVQEGTLTTTRLDLVLEKGDRLALKDSGTLTGLENVVVYVLFKPVGQGHFRKV